MSPEQQPRVKGVADIVFLLDATGSMGPCIQALKDNIEGFVTTLTTRDANQCPVRDWRAKVVGFRDYDYPEVPPVEDNPFVTTIEGLKVQLAALQAEGGVDEPESLLEALYQIARLPASKKGEPPRPDRWRSRSAAKRFVIVFTDAPFKDPLAVPAGATLEDVINELMNNRIILHVFAPEIPCYSRLSEVDRAEWHVVTGGENAQESLAVFTTDRQNFKRILQQLAMTVSGTADVPEVE
jgi:hypothetical protein